MNQIQTEEEYEATLQRILKGAEKIEHPLTTPEKRAEYMKLYDALYESARDYLMRECARKLPYMQRVYEQNGLLNGGRPNEQDI